MEKFRKLGIIEPILKSLQEQNFEQPSEIQEKAIPLILEGKDVIAGAATGSGKTLAFAAAIIKTSERGKGLQSLVLTPTRELAEQVSNTLQRFSKNKHLEIISVYGGVSIMNQIRGLHSADVVVGTPGRILDHMERRTIFFDDVKILVLDEADRMLDMGFKDDVEKIICKCPSKRQTLLFSATISSDVSRLARKYMHNPVEVSAEAYIDASKLTQTYYDVEDNQKFSLLVHFLKHEKAGLIMVFCNTQRNTDFVANNLKANGIEALAIHGGYSQDKRSRTLQTFQDKRISVLVCTDVAARGLDIKDISHIYNYDIPKNSEEYIHRIGRTARAGKEGNAISILARRDYENFQKVTEDSNLSIKKGEIPADMERIWIQSRNRDSFGRPDRNRSGMNRHMSYGHRSESQGRYGGGSHGSSGSRYGGSSQGYHRSSGSSQFFNRSGSGSSSGGRNYSHGSDSRGRSDSHGADSGRSYGSSSRSSSHGSYGSSQGRYGGSSQGRGDRSRGSRGSGYSSRSSSRSRY